MKTATFLICFIFLPVYGLNAQATYTLTGAIQLENQGLDGIHVFLGGTLQDSVFTNTRGEFSFSALPEGSYTVTPVSDQFQFTPMSLSMELAPGVSTPIPTFSANPTTNTRLESFDQIAETQLLPNFPNPFSTSTEITVLLDQEQWLKLDLFDVLGRHVTTLAEGTYFRGRHVFDFAPDGEPAGLYLIQLTGNQLNKSRLMMYRP